MKQKEMEYKQIIESAKQYAVEAKSIMDDMQVARGWDELTINHLHVFESTDFFFHGIKDLKDASTSEKYRFLNHYYWMLYFGVLVKNPDFPRKTPKENRLNFLVSIEEIFGPSLVLSNSQVVDLNSSFNKDDYPLHDLRPDSVNAFEFAPIIDAWFELWSELKNEWKDLFDEMFFAYEVFDDKGSICFKNPVQKQSAYERFLSKRDAIIDDLFARGRITTKKPMLYL